MAKKDATVVGTRARRLDVDGKVTGRARYASDYLPQGVLYGKVVRSDRASARIVSIDPSAALAVPGVEAVLFGDIGCQKFGELIADQTVFAVDRVRHIGEPVAAIAADSEATAELAARLLEVEYEELPAVFDPLDALADDAPLVHDDVAGNAGPAPVIRWGNVCSKVLLEKGNVDPAFADPSLTIVEGTYATHSVHQTPMEPRATVAEMDARGRLTVHTSTQHVFGVRQQLHAVLGIPYSEIRVIAETVGGGFGSKLEANLDIYAAVLARATRRPVRVVNSREEDLSSGNPRHPMRFSIRSAVRPDGTIVAREVRVIMDAGAYAGGSPILTSVAAHLAPGPYRIGNIRVEAIAVHTNKMAFGAYRGPSGPQTVFAVEAHTDAIADQLGIDRLRYRLQHVFHDGDEAHNGQVLANVGLREALTRAGNAIDWDTPSQPSAPGLLRGKGLACAWWLTTAGASACTVQMNEDGTAIIHTGASEIGTGSVMMGVAQVVAEELGIGMDEVDVVWGDTSGTPMDAGAQGSRTLFNMGNAAKRAAIAVREELLRRAADLLEVAPEDLEVHDGKVTVRGVPDRGTSYADLMAWQMWASEPVVGHGTFLADGVEHDATRLKGSLFPAFNAPSYHCHAAEVEVDPETGTTRVVDFVVAQDVGYAINPTGAEGQMQGGAVQGIGFALMEEIHLEDGRMLNPNLALYKIPTILDVPQVRTELVEFESANGPYGAKGVGEPPVILPPAAVASALRDAIGTPIRTTPFTPERVLRVIRFGEEAAIPGDHPELQRRPDRVGAAD